MGDTTAGAKRAVLCAFGLLASACSGTHQTGDAGGGSRLELPMIPVESAPLAGVLQFGHAEGVVRIDEPLTLAMGDGYPTEFSLMLQTGDAWLCSGPIKNEGGTLRFERVESQGSAVTAALEEGGAALRVSVLHEGEADVVIYGTFDPAGWVPHCYEGQMTGEPMPAEVGLRIRTVQVAGLLLWQPRARSEECDPAIGVGYAVATSSVPELVPLPTDARGERIGPANAASDRAVSVTVVAERGGPLEAPAEDGGLAELRFPDVSGRVHIDPAIGRRRTITVVDDSAITALDVEMLLVGNSRTPIALHDGDDNRLGASSVIRPSVTAAHVGADRLCSPVDPSWFELRSETRDRCKVEPASAIPASGQGGLDMQVRPVAAGDCAIRLRAPGIDRGEGFERTLSVTFSER